jgi:type VI secretion system protein ImpC
VSALIADYAFDASPPDIALLREISKVSAAAHMPFIGAVSPRFFGKTSMEEVASIRDLGEHFERPEYLKWKTLRQSDDARYVGLTLPRFLARIPYGVEASPARAFNYIEDVRADGDDAYLWAASTLPYRSLPAFPAFHTKPFALSLFTGSSPFASRKSAVCTGVIATAASMRKCR